MSSAPSDKDAVPVKEREPRKGSSSSSRSRNNPQIIRDELEDKYLRVIEENMHLKKQVRQHEERIKQLATKLVRVVGEKNNHEKKNDLALDDQKARIVELEGQIGILREKLTVSQQQLGSYTKLIPVIPRQTKAKAKVVQGNSSKASFGRPSDGAILINDQITQLLFEAKGESHALRDQVQRLKEELSETDKELMACKDQLQIKEIEHEDEMLALRYQLESESEFKKQKISDNIQLIRLQRDSRRTAAWLSNYETQCHTLETKLNSTNETIQQLESQLASKQQELHEEQTKNLNLTKQAEEASSILHQMKEVETQVKELQEDNKLLRQANENLVAKALESGNRAKESEIIDNSESLKQQIASLEQTIRVELQSKSELLSSLNQEKAKCSELEEEISMLNMKSKSLINQLEEAEQRLVQSVQSQELNNNKQQDVVLDEDCSKCLHFEAQLNQSKWEMLQIQDELGKTRHLLKTQVNINKEYQTEIEILNSKLEKAEAFHHDKLNEFMKVWEQRTEQMTILEKNLESISLRSIQQQQPKMHSSTSTTSLTPSTSSQLIQVSESEFANIL